MGSVSLLFVGAVLLINGLVLAGVVDARGAAPINLFVGAFLAGSTIEDLLGGATDQEVLVAAGSLLFGFTYLYVGILNLMAYNGKALGWFCGWAAVVSLIIALAHGVRFDDGKSATLWSLWVLLFLGFFVHLAFDTPWLRTAVAAITITEAFITATIPGALTVLGEWDDLSTMPVALVGAAAGLALLAFALLTTYRARTEGAALGPVAD